MTINIVKTPSSNTAHPKVTPVVNEPISNIPYPTATNLNLQGTILYVQDGDIWKSDLDGNNAILLTDRDTISTARYSPSRNHIGYTLADSYTESVPDYEGVYKEENITRNDLYLSDGLGSNSILIAQAVNKWGFIPNTTLVYYEKSEPSWFYYHYDYRGTGELWIFDPNTKNSTKLVTVSSPHDFIWSPDGKTLAYYEPKYEPPDYSSTLSIINRLTKESKVVIPIPHVGGDRGGPQPVAKYYWSNDSQYIYSAFSPSKGIDLSSHLYLNDQDAGKLTAWKIPVSTGNPIRLIPDTETSFFLNSDNLSDIFDSSFNHILYKNAMEKGDIFNKVYNISLNTVTDIPEELIGIYIQLDNEEFLSVNDSIRIFNITNMNDYRTITDNIPTNFRFTYNATYMKKVPEHDIVYLITYDSNIDGNLGYVLRARDGIFEKVVDKKVTYAQFYFDE